MASRPPYITEEEWQRVPASIRRITYRVDIFGQAQAEPGLWDRERAVHEYLYPVTKPDGTPGSHLLDFVAELPDTPAPQVGDVVHLWGENVRVTGVQERQEQDVEMHCPVHWREITVDALS